MVPDRCGYTDALQEQKFSAIKNTKKKKKNLLPSKLQRGFLTQIKGQTKGPLRLHDSKLSQSRHISRGGKFLKKM